MGFNEERRRLAVNVRDGLGETATYTPKTGDPYSTKVIIHRNRSLTVGDSRQQRNPALGQSIQTATIFFQDAGKPEPKTGDRLTLALTSEVFEVSGAALQRDEFKTVVPVRGPLS